ncbi:amino acid ABC transporter substrate-binding protein [Mesorhizobium sp. CAU 1741]|uniref:amino acid ABC transporter substrate-binding protein n=1 Tax=Mesorhizobium sp. CAU 1741 TaxID=3140366 RepID=UPI00325AADA7
MKYSRLIAACAMAAGMLASSAAYAQDTASGTSNTLETVKERGTLICGVIGTSPGFSLPDSQGVMRGIDADQCRAVAAATLGDAEKVQWVLLSPQQRFTGLQSGEVDVLFANVTWTMTRESQLGLQFPNIYYYDGQAFMVKSSLGVSSALELDGASICMLTGGTSELTVQEYFAANDMTYTPVVLSEGEEARAAFLADRCDAYTIDSSSLAGFKAAQGDAGADFIILPERMTAEPLGGAVRKGDERWFDIVRWTHFALVNAEILGINSENVESFMTSEDPRIRRFLGIEGELGSTLGLSNDFAKAVVSEVGNFGEIWERNVVGVDRGLNNVWTNGGLQYAPPFR